MPKRITPQVSSRKQPKQPRANDLVTAILDAAVQVLRTEGAARFTTTRVAERAGASVGSLYQYFPNKVSILFRLQSDEWRRTSELLRDILEDSNRPPTERLRTLVHAFLRSECDESEVRRALGSAAPLYRTAPEANSAREAGTDIIRDFIRRALPCLEELDTTLAADLIETTLTTLGSSFSEAGRTDQEIVAYADVMADMFCAYMNLLAERSAMTVLTPNPTLRPFSLKDSWSDRN